MDAPNNKIFDRLDKKTRSNIILGKQKEFVYNNKKYKVITDQDDEQRLNNMYNDFVKRINDIIRN